MNDINESLQFWQGHYEAGTTGWDRGEVHPAMLDWIACGELSPCQIVVPGCGRGHEVIHLSKLGYEVTAIDYAAAPIEFLKTQLAEQGLSATLSHGDLFSFEPAEPFDAVYEQTCLCAIQPDLRARYANRVYDWLRPGGKLFLLMMQTEADKGPPFHCEPAEMKDLFAEERWEWQTSNMNQYEHPSGGIHEMTSVLIRR